jgi:hypothetical protein
MGWAGRVAGVAVAAVVLSGCGGDPLSGPLATPSASPTATGSPRPTASAEPEDAPTESPTEIPTAPALAAERTVDGVQAFVEYYLDVANHAFATGDTRDLERLSSKDCRTCSTWIANISEVYGAGGRIRGGQAAVQSSSAAAPATSAEVKVTVRVSEQTDLDARKKTLNTIPAGQGLLVFTLERAGAGWRVGEIRAAG